MDGYGADHCTPRSGTTCQEKKTGNRLVISQPKLKAAKKQSFMVTIGEQLEPKRMSFYYADYMTSI
jgi:hypothetical protein